MEEFGPCRRVLVVAPHPDDAEIGCAGTVARLAREGVEVTYLLTTNGDKGTEDPHLTPPELARIRAQEQREAAAILGVVEVVILDHGDGELEDSRVLIGEIVYHLRRVRPEIVLTCEPFRTTFYIHRDHRITGLATMDAVFPFARDRLHFPEHAAQGLEPHKVEELYFWGTDQTDTFVDITETMELKVRATLAHRSQFSGEDGDRWIRRWAARLGEGHGFQYAEAFRAYGIRQMARRFQEEGTA